MRRTLSLLSVVHSKYVRPAQWYMRSNPARLPMQTKMVQHGGKRQETVVGYLETDQKGMRKPIWNSLGVRSCPNMLRRPVPDSPAGMRVKKGVDAFEQLGLNFVRRAIGHVERHPARRPVRQGE